MRPSVGDAVRGGGVVRWDDHNEVAVVVAVLHRDVDSSVGHLAGEQPELPGNGLPELEGDDVADRDGTEAYALERQLRGGGVVDEEVRDAGAGDGEDAAAFEAHAGTAERLPEVGQCARPVGQGQADVLPSHASTTVAVTVTVVVSELAM